MSRTVLRRLVTLVPLVWLVVTATFVVVHAAPVPMPTRWRIPD
jgi:ABC-type microcin C transport system permease subunit YejB